MKTLICCALWTAIAFAADVTGKWQGSFDITGPNGETKQDHAYMVLKQTGNEVTGTAGPAEDRQWDIRKGKVEANRVTFEVLTDGPVLQFDLTHEEGRLKGDAKGEKDGETMKAKVDLKKQ